MTKKRTKEELKEIVGELGYILLDTYLVDNYLRKVIIEDETGYKYDVYLSNLQKQNNMLSIIDKRNPKNTVENITLWLSINKPEFELCDGNTYINAKENLILFHNFLECQEIFEMSWDCISRGQGCSVCSGQQVGERTSLAYKRPDLAKEWHPTNEKNPSEVVCGSHDKVYWICSTCGYGKNREWKTDIKNRTMGIKTGCPKCSFSKGEKRIEDFLSLNDIFYVLQKKFSNCKLKKELPFDFGFPYEDNRWLCIEYHGEQHFFPVDFGGKGEEWTKQQFKENKKRDKIKKKYCEDNNIQLLIIPYWEFDNIENILTETFFE